MSTPQIIAVTIVLTAVVTMFAVAFYEICTAPVGYEDEEGFHYGDEERD